MRFTSRGGSISASALQQFTAAFHVCYKIDMVFLWRRQYPHLRGFNISSIWPTRVVKQCVFRALWDPSNSHGFIALWSNWKNREVLLTIGSLESETGVVIRVFLFRLLLWRYNRPIDISGEDWYRTNVHMLYRMKLMIQKRFTLLLYKIDSLYKLRLCVEWYRSFDVAWCLMCKR